MRQTLAISALAALCGVAATAYIYVSQPWLAQIHQNRWMPSANEGIYQRNRTGILRRLAAQAQPGRIWFIGHSHIEGLDAAQITPLALNLGVGGEKIAATATRMQSYENISTAKAIVIAVGANDVSRKPVAYLADEAQKIITALPSDVPVLWTLISPVNEQAQQEIKQANVNAANLAWQKLCAVRPKCSISNAASVLAEQNGQLKPVYHDGDGLHLNAAGYAVWRSVLKNDLDSLLRDAEKPPNL